MVIPTDMIVRTLSLMAPARGLVEGVVRHLSNPLAFIIPMPTTGRKPRWMWIFASLGEGGAASFAVHTNIVKRAGRSSAMRSGLSRAPANGVHLT